MNYFTKNEQGKTILTEDAPEDMLDAVYRAHDGMPPNDWVWEACARLWEALVDEWDIDEAIDSIVDIYYTNLCDWLAEDTSRLAWCDYALDEGTYDPSMGVAGVIMAGQHNALRFIADVMSEQYREYTALV